MFAILFFCNVTLPNIIAQELWNDNYAVLLDGKPCSFTNRTDTTSIYIYLNYTHSEHEIAIVPEFPSSMFLSLLMIFTTIVVYCSKKGIAKSKKKRYKVN